MFKATKDAAKAEKLYTRCLELNESDWQARSNRATVRLLSYVYMLRDVMRDSARLPSVPQVLTSPIVERRPALGRLCLAEVW